MSASSPTHSILAFVSIRSKESSGSETVFLGEFTSTWRDGKTPTGTELLALVIADRHIDAERISAATVLYRSDRDNEELLLVLRDAYDAIHRLDQDDESRRLYR